MKILLHAGALRRVEPALRSLGLALELYVVDAEGGISLDGVAVERAQVRPEVVWASLDTYSGNQVGLFFQVALTEPSVKWVQTFNAGLDSPVFKGIVDKGIRLSNSSAQAVAMAEYVMGQVLGAWYPHDAYRAAQAAREWRRVGFRELSQSHWLIIGYGNIGREVAQRAKAFGATVTGVRRSSTSDAFADEMAKLADVPRLLPHADVVVLSCALNDETRDLVGSAFLERMKPKSLLVNVGRGGLIDEAALIAALDRGTPGIAVLDVFREEPLPASSPLWLHPQVRVTAHTSAAGSGTVARGDKTFLDNLAIYARGGKLINEIDESFF
ncbi:MAG: D-2-hydroxyacid dehydrogenase [Alphaproteobacteria bacterium]|nr:D-2-hydroxyacid dehydrogenase [Alphaproteobacteria bacterium]